MRCWHQVVREAHGQRIAALGIGEFFEQRSADSLGEAADDLPFDQHWIDSFSDIECNNIALESSGAGITINLELHDMRPIGVDHVA